MKRIFTQRRDVRTLSQMCDYTVAHLHRFPAGTPAGDAAPAAMAAVADLKERTAAHTSLENRLGELTRDNDEAREALREELEFLYCTAEGIGACEPGFNVKLRLPLNGGDSKLLNAARSALEMATPHAELFIKYALPANFIEILQEKTRRFEKALEAANNARNAHAIARKALVAALEKAKGTWLGFDATVRNTLRGDGLALEAWNLAGQPPRYAKTRPEASAATNTNSQAPILTSW